MMPRSSSPLSSIIWWKKSKLYYRSTTSMSLLRMASGLVLASFLLIIYGQLALMSVKSAQNENEMKIVKRNSDLLMRETTAFLPQTLVNNEEENDNVIVFDRNPFNFNKNVDESESDKKDEYLMFGDNPLKATEATLKLNKWLKKMSDLDSKSIDFIHPELLNEAEAKELLFPCARDE